MNVENENEVVVEGASANSDTSGVTTTLSSTVASGVAKAKAKTGVSGRPRDPNTGLAKARVVFQQNPDMPRSELVKQFIALGIKEATANTYYHTLKKAPSTFRS